MSEKIKIGSLISRPLKKYDEDEARDASGRWTSGSGGSRESVAQAPASSGSMPHGQNTMFVGGHEIKVGDVIVHGNPLMNGGQVIAITPAAAGKEERGPRIKLRFKNGHTISNYFKPGGRYKVVRGTKAEAKTIPEKVPGAGGKKPDGGGKPAGGAVKPNAGVQPPASDEIHTGTVRMALGKLREGDKIRVTENGEWQQFRIASMKTVPGGQRALTLVNTDNGNQMSRVYNAKMEVTALLRADLGRNQIQTPESQRIATETLRDGGRNWGAALARPNSQAVFPTSVAVGDYVNMPSNWGAKYGAEGEVTGRVVGIRDQGNGRKDFLMQRPDGSTVIKSFTKAEAARAGAAIRYLPMSESEWTKYQGIKASLDRIQEERRIEHEKQREIERQKQEEERKAREAEQARRDALMGPENDRRKAELAAFMGSVDARVAQLNASDPAAPFSAGNVRNGGWGMTNADLAAICSKSGNLEGADIRKVQVGGAINAGTYMVTTADGEPLFAKKVSDRSSEIANEVMASLIGQRIGLNYAATIPCFIDGNRIITDPAKLPVGQTFNGVVMDRIRDANGKAMSTGWNSNILMHPAQAERMMLLDALMGNTDRHDGNYFYDKTTGVIPYDAGFGFNQSAKGAPREGMVDVRGNSVTREIYSTLKDRGLIYSVDNSPAQNVALAVLMQTELMSHTTVSPDGSTITMTPTDFAKSLRENVLSAVADFKRSYDVPAMNIDMPSVAGGLTANGVGKDRSGAGYGMLAGALNQVLGGGINELNTRLSIGDYRIKSWNSKVTSVQVSDPQNVFNSVTPTQQSATKTVTTSKHMIKIGILKTKAKR